VSASQSLACEVHLQDAAPFGARAQVVIAAPPERVWQLLTSFDRYPEKVPMIHAATLDGDRLTLALRFRMAIFSTTFEFTARVEREEGRRLSLSWIEGLPREIHVGFDLTPTPQGTLLACDLSYDIRSLGWVVKYFLKHHPEMALGSYAGTALVLVDAVRRAAESP
jgi:ribosome-associated toxin RatA of RatAB toxin-antitoxin module